jgi:glycosyltransferase involved in cell wall biosynthesis
VVESLATGTPVIARRLGSMPELIKDGRTGFLVDDLAGAVAATQQLAGLDRQACRDDVESRFTEQRMVDQYEQLFVQIADSVD